MLRGVYDATFGNPMFDTAIATIILKAIIERPRKRPPRPPSRKSRQKR
jgi:hypothetical protein